MVPLLFMNKTARLVIAGRLIGDLDSGQNDLSAPAGHRVPPIQRQRGMMLCVECIRQQGTTFLPMGGWRFSEYKRFLVTGDRANRLRRAVAAIMCP